MTLCEAPLGKTVAVNCFVSPTVRLVLVVFRVILVGLTGSVTVTVQFLYTELFTVEVALMVAVPAAFAVTRPDEFTEA